MMILKNKLMALLLTLIAALISGCVGSVKGLPDSSFQPSAETSLVFGRFELFNNEGQPVQLVPKSIRDIYSNLMIRSEEGKSYQIQIFREDGYFAAALPTGRYITTGGLTHTKETGMVGWQCQQKSGTFPQVPLFSWVISPTASLPFADPIEFAVLPSNATYIGNIHAFASIKERSKDNKTGRGGGDISHPPISTNVGVQAADAGVELMKATTGLIASMQSQKYLGFDSWEIKSDFEEAKKVFATLYPNHTSPIEKLGEIKLETEKQK